MHTPVVKSCQERCAVAVLECGLYARERREKRDDGPSASGGKKERSGREVEERGGW